MLGSLGGSLRATGRKLVKPLAQCPACKRCSEKVTPPWVPSLGLLTGRTPFSPTLPYTNSSDGWECIIYI